MKYIRTEKGIYEIISLKKEKFGEHYCYNVDERNLHRYSFIEETSILKQADTISELVDGYWWENKHYKDPTFNPNVEIAKERLLAWLDSDKQLGTDCLKDITVYGSIYTQGEGWTHVSKLVIENNEIKEVLLCKC